MGFRAKVGGRAMARKKIITLADLGAEI